MKLIPQKLEFIINPKGPTREKQTSKNTQGKYTHKMLVNLSLFGHQSKACAAVTTYSSNRNKSLARKA